MVTHALVTRKFPLRGCILAPPEGLSDPKLPRDNQISVFSAFMAIFREVVTLCAPRARARAVFGPDKCKDLCGHGQFFIAKCARESWGTPSFKNVTTPLVISTLGFALPF